MMMKLLIAGGMPALLDGERKPDDSNPRGYFEFERVKQLERDKSFLVEAKGKVIKVVSPLLTHLPGGYTYKVLFMNRNIEEVLASQHQMMVRRGEKTGAVPDDKMAGIYERHLQDVKAWLSRQPNFAVTQIDYNQVLQDPAPHIERVVHFLGRDLNIPAMLSTVDVTLYRERRSSGKP